MTEYLKSMLIDVRDKVTKHPTRKWAIRKLSNITAVSVHHSATANGDAYAFANYHVKTLGWAGCGYHYVILPSGHIQWVGDWNTIRAAVSGQNGYMIGICMVGDFRNAQPTAEQLKSAYELIIYLQQEIPTINIIKGHREFPNQASSCPVIDMNKFRADLGKYKKVGDFMELKLGMVNSQVGELQRMLNLLGYGLVVDNSYGFNSRNAVIKFQALFNIPTTGIVDLTTWNKIKEMAYPSQSVVVSPTAKFTDIRYGQKGDRVRDVQNLLNKCGYFIAVDGSYGNITKGAVQGFQRIHNLAVTGNVNELTWNKMLEISKIEKPYVYKKHSNGLHTVEIDPLKLKLVMGAHTGRNSAEKNMMNASFVWWEDSAKTKPYATSVLVYDGKIFRNKQPNGYAWQREPSYANGVPTPTLIIYKDGKVEQKDVAYFTVFEASKIHLAVSGIEIVPFVRTQGFHPYVEFSTVSYTTDRIAIGYNPTTKKIVLGYRASTSASNMRVYMINVGCKMSISLDSGGSANFDVDGRNINRTTRWMAAKITW